MEKIENEYTSIINSNSLDNIEKIIIKNDCK